MGQIERLKRITKSRIEAFLDSLERPDVIFPQLVKELSAKVKEAANAEAKALTAVKADQRRLDEANGMMLRFETGAIMAFNSDDITMTKQAISAQITAEKKVDSYKRSLEISESAYTAARQVRIQLHDNLKDIKNRKKEILKRHRQSQLQNKMLQKGEPQSPTSTNNIMDAVARMEAKVELEESRNEVQNEISKTLGSAFKVGNLDQLENEAEIQRRLQQLRENHNKPS